MLFSTTKQIGDWGERYAVHYLRRRGYTVKERNWRNGKCEIDIIASRLRDIVFVEVKTRSYYTEELLTAPPPGNAVRSEKQRLTRHGAKAYLYQHPTHKRPRMDVIEIWLEKAPQGTKPRVLKINHIKAAY
ncbi:MAG: YraN family protein [Clostridia bacterium]|nr:YraN family protein [Clostridia bacterium]